MLQKIFSWILSIVALFSGFSMTETEDIVRYRNLPYGLHAQRQILDMSFPKSLEGDANLLLFVHGGAWTEGSKDGYSDVLDAYCREGFVTAAINYRYCGKPNYASVSDIMHDISSALQRIKEVAASHGINLRGVMLDGGSAGAHLSLMYAYSMAEQSPIPPVAVVARSPVTDLTDPSLYDGSLHAMDPDKWCIPRTKWKEYLTCMTGKIFTMSNIEKRTDALEKISPIRYVNEHSVPTIIVHGTMDTVLPYAGSVALDAKLTSCGVPHVFVTLHGAWHDLIGTAEDQAELDDAYSTYIQTYLMQ